MSALKHPPNAAQRSDGVIPWMFCRYRHFSPISAPMQQIAWHESHSVSQLHPVPHFWRSEIDLSDGPHRLVVGRRILRGVGMESLGSRTRGFLSVAGRTARARAVRTQPCALLPRNRASRLTRRPQDCCHWRRLVAVGGRRKQLAAGAEDTDRRAVRTSHRARTGAPRCSAAPSISCPTISCSTAAAPAPCAPTAFASPCGRPSFIRATSSPASISPASSTQLELARPQRARRRHRHRHHRAVGGARRRRQRRGGRHQPERRAVGARERRRAWLCAIGCRSSAAISCRRWRRARSST